MKTDRRQMAAYVVIVLFMLVTVSHVANYAGSFEPDGWSGLGWLYALAVDGAIVVCAWLTLWKTTQRWAWVGYVMAVVASGVLNVAQVRPWDRDFGAWVYAIFPTVAQALLGFLARDAGTFTKTQSRDEKVSKLNKELKESNRKTIELEKLLADAERKLNAPFAEALSGRRSVPHEIAYKVMARDGWGCYWCGRDLRAEPRHKIHIDHFYPDSKGGATDEMNLVVSCQSCNLTKSARVPTEREVRDFKVYLVNNTHLPQKEKVWALHIAGVVDKQRDIASALGVSSSYVSSSLAELPSSPNGGTAELCERLELVGKPQEQVEKGDVK